MSNSTDSLSGNVANGKVDVGEEDLDADASMSELPGKEPRFRIKSKGPDGCVSDIIDGFSIYSLSTQDALLQPAADPREGGGDRSPPPRLGPKKIS